MAVINWAAEDIKGQPDVVQAAGESYTTNAWFSSYTGLASPMGWTEHEWTWRYSRNEWSIISGRNSQIADLYNAANGVELRQQASLLTADYVLVGPDEQSVYAVNRSLLTSTFGQPIYANSRYAVYKIK